MQSKIKVQIEGLDSDNGLVRLSALVSVLSNLKDILIQIDKLISRSSSPTVYFRITELSYSSPAIVESEILPVKPAIIHIPAIVDKYFVGLDAVKRGDAPQEFDRSLIESYHRLANNVKHHVKGLTFSSNGTLNSIEKNVDEQVTKILGHDDTILGSATGILESINIHAGLNKFNIYPIAGAEKIECSFPENLVDAAISGLKKKVRVNGVLKYRSREKYPHSISVQSIHVYPSEDELATIFDLRGIAPNATGDILSDEFIKQLRSN